MTTGKWAQLVVSATAALAAGVLLPADAQAFCRLTTEPQYTFGCNTAGTPLAWRRACLEVALDDASLEVIPPAAIRGVLADAYTRWTNVTCRNGASGLDVLLLAMPASCGLAQRNDHGANANIIAFVGDWDARGYSDQALGLTFVWNDTTTGEILDADTMLNLGRGPFRFCDEQTCDAHSVDVGALLTHEAGHFFGLAHSQEPDALMNVAYDHTTAERRLLSPDDTAGMCAIYGDRAGPAACSGADFAPIGGLSLACTDAGVTADAAPALAPASAPHVAAGGCSVSLQRREPRSPVVATFLVAACVACLRAGRRSVRPPLELVSLGRTPRSTRRVRRVRACGSALGWLRAPG